MTPLQKKAVGLVVGFVHFVLKFRMARGLAEGVRKTSHGLGRLLDEELLPDPEQMDCEEQLAFVLANNAETADFRSLFPRKFHHGQVLLLLCMDCRLSPEEILGDARPYYYTPRVAGGYISPKVREMIRLAIKAGVRLVVLTKHDDCAAERVAASEEAAEFENLGAALADREAQIALLAEELRVELTCNNPKQKVAIVDAELCTASGQLSNVRRVLPVAI